MVGLSVAVTHSDKQFPCTLRALVNVSLQYPLELESEILEQMNDMTHCGCGGTGPYFE